MTPRSSSRNKRPYTPNAPKQIPNDARYGQITAHLGVAVVVASADSNKTSTSQSTTERLRIRRNAGLVVGDHVAFWDHHVVLQPRRTKLVRQDARGKQHLIAANLDRLGIVVASVPHTPHTFVDRAVVAACTADIAPFLVVNKIDLDCCAPSDLQDGPQKQVSPTHLATMQTQYGSELKIFPTCAKTGQGVEALANFLAQDSATCGFVGTSGVGKSALLNALVPSADLLEGAIREQSGLGRHTTTTATLHTLPKGGFLADTPGFREFGLAAVNASDLSQHFIGMDFLNDAPCRFANCSHQHEPGCEVRKRWLSKTAHPEHQARYARYLSLLEEVQAEQRRMQDLPGRKAAR